ncbi:type IV secretion system DNA-binding domain-containing protein [Patescibacteria group bacterium]|nr:type IV secretion system DNA-binding domain-containing protein [Patescibacteria group bacterium]
MYYLLFLIVVIAAVIITHLFIKQKKEENKILSASNLVLFRIKVPREIKLKEGEQQKTFVDLLSVSEQLFASFHGIYQKGISRFTGSQPTISLEITSFNNEVAFYVGAARELAALIEKQLHSYFQSSQIEKITEHKLFIPEEGYVSARTFKASSSFVLPIRTYRLMEADPLNSLTSSISKMGPGESAAIQVLIKPLSNKWRGGSIKAIKLVQEGKSPNMVSGAEWLSKIGEFVSSLARSLSSSHNPPTIEPNKQLTPMQEKQIQAIQEKANKVAFETQIRILASSGETEHAEAISQTTASAFSQYSNPEGNSLVETTPKNKDNFIKSYIYRFFEDGEPKMLLNTEELASIFHFPNQYVETPNLVLLSAKDAPAPTNLPNEGTRIGEAIFRGTKQLIRIKDDDRLRHMYIIGKTGVGKSTMMETMIQDDLENGKGIAVIDPHGELIEHILKMIPKERAEDVILFDPGDMSRPLGLNLLEWKTREERDFLVQESISIFYKLFDPTRQGFIGPQFEHWMRNAALTLMDQPEGGTLIEIPRLFTDKSFEDECVKNIKDDTVKRFWTEQLAKTSDYHKSEMLNYFTSKFGRFMTNDMVRNIMGQSKSAFDLREIMDSKKIFLANLSKGKMGEVNSNLIGMILVAKLQMAAMSRVDIPEEKRENFFLYVDEFQNFATDSFATILSEARKYHLGLIIANQYIAQIEEQIRNAVFGNAGTLVSFQIGAADAEYVAKEFEPIFGEEDLINVDKFHAYIRLLIDKVPAPPFSMRTIKLDYPGGMELSSAIRELSNFKYGRPRDEVEGEIRERTKVIEPPPMGGGGGSFGPGTKPSQSP